MLRDEFLPLPSLRTLQRYMQKLSPAYGSLLVDEMKLSEGLWVEKQTLKVLGFVDIGKFTPEVQKDVPADHALSIMFQGFKGQYFQSVSAHLSRGAKYTADDVDNTEDFDENFEYELAHAGKETQKLTKRKRTTRRQEKKVVEDDDYEDTNSVASCVHSCDDSRRLWFVSDFPHLVKLGVRAAGT
ncbi:KH domain-containing protein C06G4.1 [Frankliniella fusca]|uniref:KH domain-containing protein C06G4.1 n=1 Tax=Frankliniella fusca TaxID=407009 RepID=A0AAE1LD99_9NEOP|nr:KH domain-containing protein C06G4.1 [Frankliniella fusca]